MRLPRRAFLKTAGCLTIGFCLTESFIAKARAAASPGSLGQPGPLPGDLRENPRIDSWLQVLEDGRVRVLTGKIELGQGIRTAVAQMAAEELDLDMTQVEVLMAETGVTPDEGYTAGSNSIEASAIAVRYAAAATRQKLLDMAAQKLGTPAADLTFSKGAITARNGNSISLAALLNGKQISDEVHMPVAIKPKEQHHLVGKPVPRPDNEPIVFGRPYYVHDLQLPGMVYGRIVRPPVYGVQLRQIDENAVRQQFPDLLKIVVNGSFLGVIATSEYGAIKAQNLVRKHSKWTEGPLLPKLTPEQLPDYLRSLPVRSENVHRQGDLSAATTIKASYFKPYIMHGAIGPSCAVAHYENNHLDVWSHSQGAYPLRESRAALIDLPSKNIHVKGLPGSGCYGHNGADDVAADAALLAMAYPGKPVHVQWAREDEH
ncbi:MAG TPA: molybdopterin cofactor-binding domain-containing protein, partial [Puia sp.]|nr:molybdopterin cofactor-binding domain-containing protein [Puia sp.]